MNRALSAIAALCFATVLYAVHALAQVGPLPGAGPFLLPVVSGSGPPSITFTDNTSDGTNQTTYTFTGRSIGSASSGRIVGICLAGLATAPASVTWSSVTIGGVSATQIVNTQNGSGGTAAIFTAAVPTGTTATIAGTASTTMAAVGVGVWSMTGLANSGAATNTNGSTSGTATLDLNVNAGDVGIICGYNNATAPTAAPTGYTERYDNNTGAEGRTDTGGDFTAGTAGTPRTLTITWTSASVPTASSANFR